MTTLDAQLGVKTETVYGTPVTVDRFYEFNTESIKAIRGRIDSRGLRPSHRVQRNDRFAVVNKGAAGQLSFDVLSKGFGWWLRHMLGATATTGPADSVYTHTGTVGALLGDSFTLQLNRPLNPSGTAQAFTYHGGKIVRFELSCDVDGLLVATLDLDFEDEDTSTALAAASYVSGAEPLSFAGGVINLDSVATDVTSIKITGDNALKTDRHYQRGSALKREPVENGWREYAVEVSCEFESMALANKFRSATMAGALIAADATWTAPTLAGVSAYPHLKATMPQVRIDDASPVVSGPDAISLTVSGRVLFNGSGSPITLEYKSTDTVA